MEGDMAAHGALAVETQNFGNSYANDGVIQASNRYANRRNNQGLVSSGMVNSILSIESGGGNSNN